VTAKRFLRGIADAFMVKLTRSPEAPNWDSKGRQETAMQEADVGSWAHESPPSTDMLRSLYYLNHRFLDLAAVRRDWMGADLAPLSAAQRASAAGCPYALFDLRFQDDPYWRSRVESCESWHVADAARADDATLAFVRLALFYAWHVASRAGLAAQLLLGMTSGAAGAFRSITVDRLPALAASAAPHLTPRWNGCAAYWNSLIAAASRPEPAALRRVQLFGLQLSAAARLPDS
jgi:hypothetical protein